MATKLNENGHAQLVKGQAFVVIMPLNDVAVRRRRVDESIIVYLKITTCSFLQLFVLILKV